MKHYFLRSILALGVLITPSMFAQAAYLITETTPIVASSSYTATYTAATPPAGTLKVYARVTEFGTSNWNYNVTNGPLVNLTTAPAGYPKTFNADFNFASLGIVSGKTYTYYLADGTVPNALLLTNPACFTTTGKVACPTNSTPTPPPPSGQVLTAQSFVLTPATQPQAPDTDHPGKFLANFSLVPQDPITAPFQAILAIYQEGQNNVATFLKNVMVPILAGSGTTFPTIENMAPGNYSTVLFRGQQQISNEIGFTISGTGTGNAKAVFTYAGLPAVDCDEELESCEFTITINVTTGGSLEFALFAFPKKTFDGQPKVNGIKIKQGADINLIPGQQQVSFMMAYPSITAFTYTVNDDSFWFSFYETYSNKYSDVGTTLVSSVENIPFTPNATSTYNPANPNAPLDFSGQPGITGGCGPANLGTNPALTATSAGLCTNATVTNFNYDGFNYSWNCKRSDGTTQSCSASGGADTNYGSNFLKNPLAPGLDTFPKIFAAVYNNIILPIAIPFIVLAIMFAGFKFVVARRAGSADGYTEAKRILKYTLIGTALLLGGWVIANALQGTLNSLLATYHDVGDRSHSIHNV